MLRFVSLHFSATGSPGSDMVTPTRPQGWGQVQLTKYSSTPSTPNIYQVQVLVKYSFKKKST